MNDTIPAIGNLIEPAPIKFSFATPGWYVLGGLLLLSIIIICCLSWRHYQKNKYRRNAVQWLRQRESTLMKATQYFSLLYDANTLMKRIAMQHFGRDTVASLQAKPWFDFLNKTGKASFDETDVQTLAALYASIENIHEQQVASFLNKTKRWIKTHKLQGDLTGFRNLLGLPN